MLVQVWQNMELGGDQLRRAFSQAHPNAKLRNVFDASMGTLEALLAAGRLPEAVEQLNASLAFYRCHCL